MEILGVLEHRPDERRHLKGDEDLEQGAEPASRAEKTRVFAPWVQVAILSLAFSLLSIDRGSLPQLLRLLQKEHRFTSTRLGVLGGANYVGRALGSPVCTVLATVYPQSEVRIVAGCVAMWSSGMLLMSFLLGFGLEQSILLVFARFISGAGEIVMLTLGPIIVADCAPQASKSTSLGLFLSAMPAGLALGYAGCGIFIEKLLSSATLFAALALAGIFACWVCLVTSNRFSSSLSRNASGKAQACELRVVNSSQKLIARDDFVVLIVANVFWIGVVNALQYWGPTMLQELYAASSEESGVTFGLVTFITGVVGVQAGGMITDLVMSRMPRTGQRLEARQRQSVLLGQCLLFALLALLALTAMPWAPGYKTYTGLLFTGSLLLQLGVTPVTEAILASAEGGGAHDLRALSMAALNITDQALGAGPMVLLVGVVADAFADRRWAVAASAGFVVVPILCFAALLRRRMAARTHSALA